MRKNLLLTLWLALPIVVFSGLIAWVFVSGRSEPIMRAEPVGPGAGDTGGANALGEWLAGRDPNAVERANIARREGRAIDPWVWPGGTELLAVAPPDRPVAIGWIDPSTGLLRSQVLIYRDGAWRAVLLEHRPDAGTPIYIATGSLSQRIRAGDREVIDEAGEAVVPAALAPMVPAVLASEPIPVEIAPPG